MMIKRLGAFDPSYDLAVVEVMVAELEPYLTSEILYWPLSPAVPLSPPPPLLTLGGLMLRTNRLRGLRDCLNQEQQTRLEAAESVFDRAVRKWTVHTEQRVRRELAARLSSWAWFVDDCDARRESCAHYYATEAELRTVIHQLMEAGIQPENLHTERERLRGLDARLRRWLKPSDFVWRAELEPAYPPQTFWWLYCRPVFPPP